LSFEKKEREKTFHREHTMEPMRRERDRERERERERERGRGAINAICWSGTNNAICWFKFPINLFEHFSYVIIIVSSVIY
jgi:hypothetical protein